MGNKLKKVPALEYFHYDSKTSLNPSPLTDSSCELESQSNIESPQTTAESAVLALEQKSEKTSNIALFARPRLEKIGAVNSPETNANRLKSQFSQLSKHFEKSGNLLLETQKSFEKWSKTFESDEIMKLSREIGQFLQLHDLMNKSFAERFDNIAFKLKPLIKQEFKRDEDLAKLIKSRREKEEISKKCRDQSVITQSENKVEYRYHAVRSAQTLLEKRVREDLRPSLFAYAYIMKNSSTATIKLLDSSTLDMKSFDNILTDKGNLIQAQLNFTRQGLLLDVNMELLNGKYYASATKRNSIEPKKKHFTKHKSVSQESLETGSSQFVADILEAYADDHEENEVSSNLENLELNGLHVASNQGLVVREIPNNNNQFVVNDNYQFFAENSSKFQGNVDASYDNSNVWARD
ncbi:hypothetical protein CANINC_004262 [Pichia inconspicua]|uniref:Uncharacterized protein n=1 Tax=Pichia inconspicua TaxID=52247 RepID=A0A4T0WWA6_9ASCO|nr:hypothetical protein CANINC_004262 [[Candida] inconspicua]